MNFSQGVYSIITSPEKIKETDSLRTIQFNGDLKQDAIAFQQFCFSKHIDPGPFSKDHGIDKCNDYDPIIHSVKQFQKEIQIIASLNNIPETFQVVLYYCGHGVYETGDWLLEGDEFITYDAFTKYWKEGCNDTTCNKNLTLLMDSCYSGSWVNRLRNDDTMQNFPICFISATSADGFLVNAFSGVFTEEIFRESITSNSVMVYTTESYKSELFEKQINSIKTRLNNA